MKELDRLTAAVKQAIVDLSVHPAGCVEWTWYENLCLEVAERLDDALKLCEAGITPPMPLEADYKPHRKRRKAKKRDDIYSGHGRDNN